MMTCIRPCCKIIYTCDICDGKETICDEICVTCANSTNTFLADFSSNILNFQLPIKIFANYFNQSRKAAYPILTSALLLCHTFYIFTPHCYLFSINILLIHHFHVFHKLVKSDTLRICLI